MTDAAWSVVLAVCVTAVLALIFWPRPRPPDRGWRERHGDDS